MEQIKKGSMLKAAVLSFVFACATALCVAMPAQAWAANYVAEVNDTPYETFDKALEAAAALGEEEVTITLLDDVEGGFNVGNSKGTKPQNFILNLNGNTLKAQPGVGSNNQSNGIRVLYKSTLTIMNGTVTADDGEGIGVMIANYGTLTLDGVSVEPAAETQYTVNNRGDLTLKGDTTVTDGTTTAITNDPYNLYITEKTDAVLNIADSNVTVGNVLVELYGNAKNPDAEVVLNISAGTIDSITDDTATNTPKFTVKGNVTGGTFTEGVDSQYIAEGSAPLVDTDGAYTVLPEEDAKDQAVVTVTTNGNVVYYKSRTTADSAVEGTSSEVVPLMANVTLVYNNGAEDSLQTVQKGTAMAPVDEPTRDGYTFAGWYTNEALTEAYEFGTVVMSDMTLYAKWTEASADNAGANEPAKDSDASDAGDKSATPKTGDAAPFAAVAGITALAIAGVAIARRQMI